MKKRNFIQSAALSILLLAVFAHVSGSSVHPPCHAFASCKTNAVFAFPTFQFNKIWTEHNVHENGKKGMRIHIDFSITGMQGKECKAVAYFYSDNGYPLQDHGGGYRTANGSVSSSKEFTPPYERSHNSNFTIFMPYGELHVNGTYSLKYRVSVFYHEMNIGNSTGWETFKLTWRTNVPESECPKCGC